MNGHQQKAVSFNCLVHFSKSAFHLNQLVSKIPLLIFHRSNPSFAVSFDLHGEVLSNRIITAPLLKKKQPDLAKTLIGIQISKEHSFLALPKERTTPWSSHISFPFSYRLGIFYINYNFIYFLCHRRLICCQLKFFQCLFTP